MAERTEERTSARRLTVVLVLLTVLLYGRGLTNSVGEFPDAPHHLMNGIFLFDALHDPLTALRDPQGYLFHYYRHYPAVNLGYYLPVFAVIEAGVMLLFGVSGASGQITVLLLAVAMTLFAFAWFRLRFEVWWAASATGLLIATPFLVYFGRDLMLEVPVLAFTIGAMWAFEHLSCCERPTWRFSLFWAALTILALWTKQHAMILPGIFLVATLTTRRWRHLGQPAIVVGALLVMVGAAGVFVVLFKFGGDAVGHSIGFTAQHAIDRFNWAQWFFYPKCLPSVVGWPVLILSVLGLFPVLAGRVKNGSVLIAWGLVFYLMHSYPKAQDPRYAVLWLPPIVALAVVALRDLPTMLRSASPDSALRLRGWFGSAAMAVLLGYTLWGSAHVMVPRVPSAYQRAMDDLCDRLGLFTCLTFVPERANQPPVLYRLAVEERKTKGRDIFSFGRILRANQVLRDWRTRWPDAAAVAQAFKDWNVKYLLLESPTRRSVKYGDVEIHDVMDEILARKEFQPLREYPVDLSAPRHPIRLFSGEFPRRTLTLYERIDPMEFHPDAGPTLRPKRTPITIPGSDAASITSQPRP